MKLHIGSGKVYLPGWTNLDIVSTVIADMHANALSIPLPQESCEIIYASHVLEHFSRHLTLAALTHWRSLLIPGGILRLSVPNFDAIVKRFLITGNVVEVMGLLYGGQQSMANAHYITFTKNSLDYDLMKVGFKDIRYWDWRAVDHGQFDDYSQAYLPHLDKKSGMLMSLNLEATK
jgi:predicted SAM-dependent methyltransferase